MRRFIRSLLPILVLIVICPAVSAWGPTGHQLVGDVAQRHLTPTTKAAVKELLGDRSLADVSVWADSIKGQRPETRPWHYANPQEGAESFDMERDCGDKSCVVEQINLDVAVLRDPEATHVAKVEALMFLVHFVGDVHQPLHLGRASDRGGNNVEVEYKRSKTNLHRLWDSGLIDSAGLSHDEYLAGLVRLINVDGGKRVSWLKELDPVVWANESYGLAHTNAYVVPQNGRIGDAYYRRNIKVINERLAMAGVRLAAILNELYDPVDPLFVPAGDEVKRIVFAFGVPSSNEHIVRFRNAALFQAIDSLGEDQHFTVIFYQDGKLLEPPPRSLSAKPATEKVKKRVQAWIDPEAGHLKPFSSKGDPMAVLHQAFRYKPDLVYLWIEDSRGMAQGDEALATLLEQIDGLNETGAALNMIEWMRNPNKDLNRPPTVAEMIAEHTGGQHRFYGNDDVMSR